MSIRSNIQGTNAHDINTEAKKSRYLISISGMVDEDMYIGFLESVGDYIANKEKYSGITILITSLGGAAYVAMAIYDIIKSLKTEVYTVATGECASAATIIFALGTKRFISENTEFLVHTARMDYANIVTVKEIKFLNDSILATNEKVKKILKACITNEDFHKRLDATFANVDEDFITVEELLQYGVATEKLTDFEAIL